MIVPIYVGDKITLVWHLILISAVLTTVTSNYLSQNGLMNGLASPSEIDAVVGEEIYLKIIAPVSSQTSCHYRMDGGTDVDIQRPHKDNIEAWNGEICGLRIKDITVKEHGFWRLTSSNDNEKTVARGMVFVNVKDEIPIQQTQKNIDSLNEDIAPKNTAYCYVKRPDQTGNSFPQHDTCVFPEFQNEYEGQGMWQVVSGVKGKTQEISFQVNVQTIVEQLLTFVERNAIPSTLNMKCKLVNSKKTQKFCRFLRLSDDVGYNLEEGRGDERIRYYGNGFSELECGISIANPDENDKSPWKCFIGVDDENGEMKTLGVIVDGTDPKETKTEVEIETNDVYGLEQMPVNILCKRSIPTDYCWFRDPSGQKITLSDQNMQQSSDKYRYNGAGIKLGECGLTILSAEHNHSGTWSCHMGATHVAQTDTVGEISVRIAETPLVATNLFHEVQQGTSLILECRSIPEHSPLDYCRFVLPDGTGFSINEHTTAKNPHMNNYYWNPNRRTKTGYCSIIVEKVNQLQHQGQWMCATKLTGNTHESFDEFRVNVFESNVSTAQATGMMAFACIFLIGGLVFIAFKSYRKKHNVRRQTVVSYVTGADRISISSGEDSQPRNIIDIN